MSSCRLSRELSLWAKELLVFQKKDLRGNKIKQKKHLLNGRADVDGIAMGSHEKQSHGRSKGLPCCRNKRRSKNGKGVGNYN